jgi:hypothetical protein
MENIMVREFQGETKSQSYSVLFKIKQIMGWQHGSSGEVPA